VPAYVHHSAGRTLMQWAILILLELGNSDSVRVSAFTLSCCYCALFCFV